MSFRDAFAGRDPGASIQLVQTRAKNARVFNDHLADYFSARREAEEAYVKNLARISKRFAMPDASLIPTGFAPVLDRLLVEVNELAEAHAVLERRLQRDCEEPLRAAAGSGDLASLRSISDDLAPTLKDINTLEAQLARDQKKFESKRTGPNHQRVQDTQRSLASAFSEWDARAPTAFDVYERVDRERLALIRETVHRHAQATSDAARAAHECAKTTVRCADSFRPAADVDAFIASIRVEKRGQTGATAPASPAQNSGSGSSSSSGGLKSALNRISKLPQTDLFSRRHTNSAVLTDDEKGAIHGDRTFDTSMDGTRCSVALPSAALETARAGNRTSTMPHDDESDHVQVSRPAALASADAREAQGGSAAASLSAADAYQSESAQRAALSAQQPRISTGGRGVPTPPRQLLHLLPEATEEDDGDTSVAAGADAGDTSFVAPSVLAPIKAPANAPETASAAPAEAPAEASADASAGARSSVAQPRRVHYAAGTADTSSMPRASNVTGLFAPVSSEPAVGSASASASAPAPALTMPQRTATTDLLNMDAFVTERVHASLTASGASRVVVVGEVALALREAPTPLHTTHARVHIDARVPLEKMAVNPNVASEAAARSLDVHLGALWQSQLAAGSAVVMRYQLRISAAETQRYVPLLLRAQWKCEAQQSSLLFTYRSNGDSLYAEQGAALDGLAFQVALPSSQRVTGGVLSRPTGEWDPDVQQFSWHVPLLPASDTDGHQLLARFPLAETGTPVPVEASWEAPVTVGARGVFIEQASRIAEVVLCGTTHRTIAGKYFVESS
ncbi:Suppressor of Profilin deletion [Malassezia cuniculi]|uniref:Suppressor of Profilin deletion n=1 Tax=Malassezia cuniculi TaxID=948313 RepID=A0AAF0ERU6_9BASI|nr:Suppressor of Profilin deletion [Malassezia cuniculi]